MYTDEEVKQLIDKQFSIYLEHNAKESEAFRKTIEKITSEHEKTNRVDKIKTIIFFLCIFILILVVLRG